MVYRMVKENSPNFYQNDLINKYNRRDVPEELKRDGNLFLCSISKDNYVRWKLAAFNPLNSFVLNWNCVLHWYWNLFQGYLKTFSNSIASFFLSSI